jgi:hypothetical protein
MGRWGKGRLNCVFFVFERGNPLSAVKDDFDPFWATRRNSLFGGKPLIRAASAIKGFKVAKADWVMLLDCTLHIGDR